MPSFEELYSGLSEAELRAMNEGMADMEFSVPYIERLYKDPLARVGFDPSRLNVVPKRHPQSGGMYFPSNYSPSSYFGERNQNIRDFIGRHQLDKRQTVDPGNMYLFAPLKDTYGANDVVLHEARHAAFDKLGMRDGEREEQIVRAIDARTGNPEGYLRKFTQGEIDKRTPKKRKALTAQTAAAEQAASGWLKNDRNPKVYSDPFKSESLEGAYKIADIERTGYGNMDDARAARNKMVESGDMHRRTNQDGSTTYSLKKMV